MCLRWTAAGMLEAKTDSGSEGYRGLANLAVAIERDSTFTSPTTATTQEAAIAVTV